MAKGLGSLVTRQLVCMVTKQALVYATPQAEVSEDDY